MSFKFNRSARYLDLQAYRQAYKAWVCLDMKGQEPPIPTTVSKADVAKVQGAIKRLYAQEKEPRNVL